MVEAKRPPRILVTNDDGVHSPGLKLLYDAVKEFGRVYVVAPETPKSASGLGITLHKPLRLEEVTIWDGVRIYVTNGTPSDIVYLALNEVTPEIDLAVSGVNIGDNTSVQVILSSGTVGAAMQAALVGVKAVAFSAAVDEALEITGGYAAMIKRVVSKIVKWVLENGLPDGVDVLNVNFPPPGNWRGGVSVAPPARMRYLQRVTINYDPRGKKYYWLYGMSIEPPEGTDVYEVHVKGSVTLTPLSLDLTPHPSKWDSVYRELSRLASLIVGSLAGP